LSAFRSFGRGNGVALTTGASKRFVAFTKCCVTWPIGEMIDVGSVGDREQPRTWVSQDRPRSQMTPDPYSNVLKKVVGVVPIAAEAAERRQDGGSVLIDQVHERLTILVHASVIPEFRGVAQANAPGVLPE
jgi:hypothetical protein